MKSATNAPAQPLPVLVGLRRQPTEIIRSWPGVHAAIHWDTLDRSRVNGAEFSVNQAALGHIHLDGEVHLATTHALGGPLLRQGLALPAPFGRGTGDWVAFPIRTEADAEQAIWLFQLNYDRLSGVPLAKLLERLQTAGTH